MSNLRRVVVSVQEGGRKVLSPHLSSLAPHFDIPLHDAGTVPRYLRLFVISRPCPAVVTLRRFAKF